MLRKLHAVPFVVGLTFAISGCAPTASAPPQHPAAPPTCPDPPASPPTASHTAEPAVARAIEIVKAIHSERRDAVYATFGEKFRNAVSIDKYRAVAQEIDASRGKLLDATYAEEDVLEKPSATLIRVVAVFEHGAELYKVALDDKLVLVGLLVRPLNADGNGGATGGTSPSAGPADDYVAKRKYVLPASGAWDVGNGGRSQSTNRHVGNTQQWYAFDLVRKGADGKTHTGDGKKNEDYLDFGQQIRAPGDGTVITIVDGVPDNAPGQENPYVAPGNYVVIDHGDGEYSFIAHVERGSFAVKVGAKVKAGDVVGKVGNSGNSSEPHIHWHLADAPQFEKGRGLPIRFASLRVNGKTVDAPAPVRDDRLEAAP